MGPPFPAAISSFATLCSNIVPSHASDVDVVALWMRAYTWWDSSSFYPHSKKWLWVNIGPTVEDPFIDKVSD